MDVRLERREKVRIRYNTISVVIISIALSIFTSVYTFAAGQSSANYSIEADVISGGGGGSSSANYTNESTVGQTTDGNASSSSNYQNNPGFWNAVNKTATAPSYNPYDTDQNCEISNFELLTAINLWAANPPQLTNFELLTLINVWATGPYC